MTDSRKRAKILADNRKGHHAIKNCTKFTLRFCELLGCNFHISEDDLWYGNHRNLEKTE